MAPPGPKALLRSCILEGAKPIESPPEVRGRIRRPVIANESPARGAVVGRPGGGVVFLSLLGRQEPQELLRWAARRASSALGSAGAGELWMGPDVGRGVLSGQRRPRGDHLR